MSITKYSLFPMFFFLMIANISCRQNQTTTELRGITMGTFYQVKLVGAMQEDEPFLAEGVKEQMELVNSLMSNWIFDSDISRFNRHEVGTPLTIQPQTAIVIQRALEIAELSMGAFDPTLSPLIELWGFGTRQDIRFPEQAAIDAALDQVGYKHLSLHQNQLSKDLVGLNLNLSSLAKGYAVDLVCAFLKEQDLTDFMVNVGGEVRVSGHNAQNEAWRMAIAAPDSTKLQAIHKVTQLTNVAMATSGDYRNFFTYEGVSYSHLIDARTGRPISTKITSVSVIAPDCMTADGLATVLSLLTPEAGLELVERMPSVECILLLREQDGIIFELQSSGMSAFLLQKG